MGDFIGLYPKAIPIELCDEIIGFFKQSKFINVRSTENRSPWRSDKQIIMESFAPGEASNLINCMSQSITNYVNEFCPVLLGHNFISSLTLLQKTEPKQGYHNFHAEDTAYYQTGRTLAWMVYLNDVEEGGETEFLHQQKKVKPEKGKLVIWPGAFTHLHRGNPPMSTKYIATGWFQVDGGSFHERVFKLKTQK